MKNYKLILSAAFGLALMLVTSSALADDKNGAITLLRVVGNAVYSIDGGHTWSPAVVGKDFQPGTLVRTEDKSTADLLVGQSFPDRNVKILQINSRHNPAPNTPPQIEKNIIRLQPNTILGVDKLTVPDNDPTVISDCELNLKKGRILASVRKVSPSSEYLVKVPNGVAAVRGTQFSLSVDGPDTSCQVSDGTVWMSITLLDANGNPMTDSSGNPLPSVQISVSPGEEVNLTPAVISSLESLALPGGATPSPAQVAQVMSTVQSAVTSSVTPQPTPVIAQLKTFFPGLQTTSITITAPDGSVFSSDNGTSVHVSTK